MKTQKQVAGSTTPSAIGSNHIMASIGLQNIFLRELYVFKHVDATQLRISGKVLCILYRMGHEKVARLLFCTCSCDILSGVSVLIA